MPLMLSGLSIVFAQSFSGRSSAIGRETRGFLFCPEIDDFGIERGRNIQEPIVFVFQMPLEEGDGASA